LTMTPCVAASKSAPTMSLASRTHAGAKSERRETGRSHGCRRYPASRPGGRRIAPVPKLQNRDGRLCTPRLSPSQNGSASHALSRQRSRLWSDGRRSERRGRSDSPFMTFAPSQVSTGGRIWPG
jgi:hypothetical protein